MWFVQPWQFCLFRFGRSYQFVLVVTLVSNLLRISSIHAAFPLTVNQGLPFSQACGLSHLHALLHTGGSSQLGSS